MALRQGGIKRKKSHLLILTFGISTNSVCNIITWWAISTKWTLGWQGVLIIKSAICLSIKVQGIYFKKSLENTNKSNIWSIQNHQHYVTAFQCTLKLEMFVFLIALFRAGQSSCLGIRYRNQRELELNLPLGLLFWYWLWKNEGCVIALCSVKWKYESKI